MEDGLESGVMADSTCDGLTGATISFPSSWPWSETEIINSMANLSTKAIQLQNMCTFVHSANCEMQC